MACKNFFHRNFDSVRRNLLGAPVSTSPFDFQDLLQLVELIKSSAQFSEFKLRANGIELELRRGTGGESPPAPSHSAPLDSSLGAPPARTPAPVPPPVARPTETAAAVVPTAIADGTAVTAPMVGTVYLAPEPGAAPFVSLGQRVEADTQVCIVEVMKLMNAVTAGHAGVVRQILVVDAESVGYGQPLFVISPA
jgi:acetyl-CoA carboxylase biotin carboxyl carrier protein